MPLNQGELQTEIERLAARHGMPGVVVAAWQDGTLATAAAGVANLNTGAPMTVDTGFLTGSITKVWTATLVMTFVDEGLLDLDVPIVEYAPDVQFGADLAIAKSLTTRHLLNHTSGVDSGSYFPPQPRSYPDSVEDYLPLLSKVGKLTEPGRISSYNNAGWIVVEAILRRLTGGRTFHQLLRERVIEPLGLRRTVLSTREAILHNTAVGSFPTGDGGAHQATPEFMFPDAFAAAGATLITTVDDTIRLLRLHLDGGTTADGRQLLRPKSVAAMQTPTSQEPTGPASGFGLGWMYVERDGRRILHHGGGSHGGVAWAVISPADDVAAIAFANSSASMPLHNDLLELLLPPGASPVAMPAPTVRDDVELRPFAGSYRCKGLRADIVPDAGELLVRLTPIVDELHGARPVWRGVVTEFQVAPTGERSLASRGEATSGIEVLTFSEPSPDGYQLLYLGRQLLRRTAKAS